MANPTMTLIASNTVGSGGASSVTFSSIPSTYTDLKVVYSAKLNVSSIGIVISMNGSPSYSAKVLEGSGSSAYSYNSTTLAGYATYNSWVAFSNGEMYFPNYTSSNYKSVSADSVTENNGSLSVQGLFAGLFSTTSAITSLTFTPDLGSFVQYSTFYLYGISSS